MTWDFVLPALMGGQVKPPAPVPQPRSPLVLPRCNSCPSPNSFDQDLAKIWPNGVPQTRDYLRASCWGIPVYVNGAPLPWVPDITSSRHPERFLSYIFPSYPTAYQEQWFLENQRRGLTHVVFSWPNARAQAGQTLGQFKADCQRAKAAGFYVHVKLWSKNFDAHNMTLAEWQAYAAPIFAGLAGAVDEYSPWEYDSYNRSGQVAIDVHKWLGKQAHAQGASFWCHFYPLHGHWDPLGYVHWWQSLADDCDGLDHQADPRADIGQTQSRIVDHLRDLHAATDGFHKFREFEPGTPTRMFDGDHPNEDEARAFGYATICTVGQQPVWGFGADASWMNGTAI